MVVQGLLFLLATLAAPASGSAAAETRAVGAFTGVHVSDGIEVNSNVSADGNVSVTLDGSADLLPQVRSSVDHAGTLVLYMAPGGVGGSGVVARVLVPGPLSYAGASSGGQLIADSVAGTMTASSGGRLVVQTLAASWPVSVTASSSSEIVVAGGTVGFVTLSCSSLSAMRLGGLQADSATVSVSSKSSLTGLTVGAVQLTATSGSSVSLTAVREVGLSCSGSRVHIGGAAAVTTLFEMACRVDHARSLAVLDSGRPTSGNASIEVRHVGAFTGVHASDGIEVRSNVSADGTTSLSIEGSAEILPQVRSFVDGLGTLVLSMAPGTGGTQVVARVSVAGPLSYAGASSGGQLAADSVAGTMTASSGGRLVVQTLAASWPVSVTASSSSEIVVAGGAVGFVTLSCSGSSAVRLGGLRADSAVVSVSARSSLSGMTVGVAQVTAASASSVSLTATQGISLSCSGSEVHIGGSAALTVLSQTACLVDRTSSIATTPAFWP